MHPQRSTEKKIGLGFSLTLLSNKIWNSIMIQILKCSYSIDTFPVMGAMINGGMFHR